MLLLSIFLLVISICLFRLILVSLSLMCGVQLSSSSRMRPKNFACCCCFIRILFIFSVMDGQPFFALNNIHWVLDKFKVSLFAWNQSWSNLRSCSRFVLIRLMLWSVIYNVVSSVNRITCECFMTRCKSLLNSRKIRGPRHDPCGAPIASRNCFDYMNRWWYDAK